MTGHFDAGTALLKFMSEAKGKQAEAEAMLRGVPSLAQGVKEDLTRTEGNEKAKSIFDLLIKGQKAAESGGGNTINPQQTIADAFQVAKVDDTVGSVDLGGIKLTAGAAVGDSQTTQTSGPTGSGQIKTESVTTGSRNRTGDARIQLLLSLFGKDQVPTKSTTTSTRENVRGNEVKAIGLSVALQTHEFNPTEKSAAAVKAAFGNIQGNVFAEQIAEAGITAFRGAKLKEAQRVDQYIKQTLLPDLVQQGATEEQLTNIGNAFRGGDLVEIQNAYAGLASSARESAALQLRGLRALAEQREDDARVSQLERIEKEFGFKQGTWLQALKLVVPQGAQDLTDDQIFGRMDGMQVKTFGGLDFDPINNSKWAATVIAGMNNGMGLHLINKDGDKTMLADLKQVMRAIAIINGRRDKPGKENDALNLKARRKAGDFLNGLFGMDVKESTDEDTGEIIFKTDISGSDAKQLPLWQAVMMGAREHAFLETVDGRPIDQGGDGTGNIKILDDFFQGDPEFNRSAVLTRQAQIRGATAGESGEAVGAAIRRAPRAINQARRDLAEKLKPVGRGVTDFVGGVIGGTTRDDPSGAVPTRETQRRLDKLKFNDRVQPQ